MHSPVLGQEAALRRLPENLEPHQAMYFDGIRHAMEISELAFNRLSEALTRIALEKFTKEAAREIHTAALLDAWAFVDNVDRFRQLWSDLPRPLGWQSGVPQGQKSFAEISQPLRDVRNVTAHFAQNIGKIAAKHGAAIGIISWVTETLGDRTKVISCSLIPESIHNAQFPLVNPGTPHSDHQRPTSRILLSAGMHTANLSEVFSEMVLRVKMVETSLAHAISLMEPRGEPVASDYLLKVFCELKFEPSPSDQNGSP